MCVLLHLRYTPYTFLAYTHSHSRRHLRLLRPYFGYYDEHVVLAAVCRFICHPPLSRVIRSFLIKLIQSMTNFDKKSPNSRALASIRISINTRHRRQLNPWQNTMYFYTVPEAADSLPILQSKHPSYVDLCITTTGQRSQNTRALFAILVWMFVKKWMGFWLKETTAAAVPHCMAGD